MPAPWRHAERKAARQRLRPDARISDDQVAYGCPSQSGLPFQVSSAMNVLPAFWTGRAGGRLRTGCPQSREIVGMGDVVAATDVDQRLAGVTTPNRFFTLVPSELRLA